MKKTQPVRYVDYYRCSTDDQTHGDFTTIDTQREADTRHVEAIGVLVGDDLERPVMSHVVTDTGGMVSVLKADYDSASSIRSDPDPAQAFVLAYDYIFQGTPVRKTNRIGPSGTRLVEGIAPCNITIYVR